MMDNSEVKNKIFALDELQFNQFAVQLFKKQACEIPVYNKYLKLLGCNPMLVNKVEDIKFLPIEFFKHNKINVNLECDFYFQSSGTSDAIRSKHYVNDLDFYNKVAQTIFEDRYGSLSNIAVFAVLPSYQENNQSSLIFMVNDFIEKTHYQGSSYYQINQSQLLYKRIEQALQHNKKVILLGVTYALVALAQSVDWEFEDLIVMETGGMKGRGEELVREDVHRIISQKFGTSSVHSEYGMTELLSQAYAAKDGLFVPAPWMKIVTRQINDPFKIVGDGAIGGINIIDLANVDSCAFIETQDLGKLHQGGNFEVLGRIDQSETRGCNMLEVI